MSGDKGVVLRHQVAELRFGMMSESEVRNSSVKAVTSPATYDGLGHPLPGGLHDPAFGPSDRNTLCPTCGLTFSDCPGHPGHIELPVPVYHPLLFRTMFRVLRCVCLNCHKLKGDRCWVRLSRLRLALVDAGETSVARELEEEIQRYGDGHPNKGQDGPRELDADVQQKEESGLLLSNETREKPVDELNKAEYKSQNAVLLQYEKRLAQSKRAERLSMHDRMYRRHLVEEFLRHLVYMKKCNNCGTPSQTLRKDGCRKIFVRPLSARALKTYASQVGNLNSHKSAIEKLQEVAAGRGDSDEEGALMGGGEGEAGVSSDEEEERKHDIFMPTIEVEAQLKLLWKQEAGIMTALYGQALSHSRTGTTTTNNSPPAFHAVDDGYQIFFIRALAVPPTRFRPSRKVDADTEAEHPQNIYLSKILALSAVLRNGDGNKDLMGQLSTWIELQDTVNQYMDSSLNTQSSNASAANTGIRQILERKEGIFRKNMMGKRVNYACRSVISPDPYIGTSEIGIPIKFAKILTVPRGVAPWNVKHMRQLVERGSNDYPGANFVEDAGGTIYNLSRLNHNKRKAIAARLLSVPGQRVWCQVTDGDTVLVNRQPTLHKPGIMGHRVRVLRNPTYQTIRMHYANCNTYNADFDGDEVNCHLPQSELAEAEARLIAFTDEQYLAPTDGKPLRGLIQDSVVAGVKLSGMDTWLNKLEYQQMVFQALAGLPGLEICPSECEIDCMTSAIIKPEPRWSGKQVFSTVLHHISKKGYPRLNLEAKTRTPKDAFGEHLEEHKVIIRDGELLRGVMDKAAFGATPFGLVHACHELYGARVAGLLLTALGRLLVAFLQISGHTCGIEDLTLTREADEARFQLINEAAEKGHEAAKEYAAEVEVGDMEIRSNVRSVIGFLLSGKDRSLHMETLESKVMSVLSNSTSTIITKCLTREGLEKPFPSNCFSMMVCTGAKGSMVNHTQVSCALGQQTLEGRRVPIMNSGKSLPSFLPYETSPRAGGFVADRFLSGIRPQEYFFHCMAGREGLIDTAVKTSRSGYLQRCLVKHLEELTVCYDGTVRDAEGSVYQFLYGEDGIDPTFSKYISGNMEQLNFLAENYTALAYKDALSEDYIEQMGFDVMPAIVGHDAVRKSLEDKDRNGSKMVKGAKEVAVDDILYARKLKPGRNEWSRDSIEGGWHLVSIRKMHKKHCTIRYLRDGHVEKKVPWLISIGSRHFDDSGNKLSNAASVTAGGSIPVFRRAPLPPVLANMNPACKLGAVSEHFQRCIDEYVESPALQKKDGGGVDADALRVLLWIKYMRSLSQPGEMVGSIAAQSVGEPSTQMTLNTFHLAGHGGANVTLGIPRLREIIMSASRNPRTPSMTIPLKPSSSTRGEANILARSISELRLVDVLLPRNGLRVVEQVRQSKDGEWKRFYVLELHFYNDTELKDGLNVQFIKVCQVVCQVFLPKLLLLMKKSMARAGAKASVFKQKKDTGGGDGDSLENMKVYDDEEEDEKAVAQTTTGKELKKSLDEIFGPDSDRASDSDVSDNENNGAGGPNTTKANKMGGYNDSYGAEEEEDVPATQDSTIFGDHYIGNNRMEGEEERGGSSEPDDESDELQEIVMERSATAAVVTKEKNDKVKMKEMAGGMDMIGESEKENLQLVDDAIPDSVAKNPLFVHAKVLSGTSPMMSMELITPASQRKLLMACIAEEAARKTLVRSYHGIRNAYVLDRQTEDGQNGLALQTEGCDFNTLWSLQDNADCGNSVSLLDFDRVISNDIWQVLNVLGVEACRASIVSEMISVFGVYGIDVDTRHLGLIADYMTFMGGFRPVSRAGMMDAASACLQMSFETTTKFLIDAALEGKSDHLDGPSSRIVVGRVGGYGTGCFDLRLPVPTKVGQRMS